MRSPPPFATLAPLRKPPAVADVENAVLEDHVIMEDVTCAICLSILHEPTSLQCGHTFCCSCVRAALRRTSACPVCRQPAHQRLQVNRLLARLLMQIFPNETLARRAEVAQDAARQPRPRTTGSFANVLRLAPILLRRVGLFASLVLLAALCALAAADSGRPRKPRGEPAGFGTDAAKPRRRRAALVVPPIWRAAVGAALLAARAAARRLPWARRNALARALESSRQPGWVQPGWWVGRARGGDQAQRCRRPDVQHFAPPPCP